LLVQKTKYYRSFVSLVPTGLRYTQDDRVGEVYLVLNGKNKKVPHDTGLF